MAHAHPNRFLCFVGFLVFYCYPYIYICSTLRWHKPSQTVFFCLVVFCGILFLSIYIYICSILRWHMPTQTVFSASWGSWYSIFIHIYIYLFHTKMAHAHPNRFLCFVGFLIFYFYPYIYMCSILRWHMPTQTVFSASWGSWYSIFIHIYIYICSTLRWYMPTQTVFSASWGSWYSIFIHIYI